MSPNLLLHPRDRFDDLLHGRSGLSSGAIGGIVGGTVGGVALGAVAIYVWQRRKRASRRREVLRAADERIWHNSRTPPRDRDIPVQPTPQHLQAAPSWLENDSSAGIESQTATDRARLAALVGDVDTGARYVDDRSDLDMYRRAPAVNPLYAERRARRAAEMAAQGYTESDILLASESGFSDGPALTAPVSPDDSVSAVGGLYPLQEVMRHDCHGAISGRATPAIRPAQIGYHPTLPRITQHPATIPSESSSTPKASPTDKDVPRLAPPIQGPRPAHAHNPSAGMTAMDRIRQLAEARARVRMESETETRNSPQRPTLDLYHQQLQPDQQVLQLTRYTPYRVSSTPSSYIDVETPSQIAARTRGRPGHTPPRLHSLPPLRRTQSTSAIDSDISADVSRLSQVQWPRPGESSVYDED